MHTVQLIESVIKHALALKVVHIMTHGIALTRFTEFF